MAKYSETMDEFKKRVYSLLSPLLGGEIKSYEDMKKITIKEIFTKEDLEQLIKKI
jgi:hypothetical protein